MELERIPPLRRGEELSIQIPPVLAHEFGKDLRVVIKFPWIIGIPIPERLLQMEIFKELVNDYDVMVVPRRLMR